ncbi:MAG: rane protein [Acidimicrobiales bacterium]|jgi:phosphatidylglycerol lysyltransferase|nr:rane protein [Acidimicrobiales bacterium]
MIAVDQRALTDVLELDAERVVARWGRASTAPFVTAEGMEVAWCGLDAVAGYARRGRWAVTVGDPVAPPGDLDDALDGYLDAVASRQLRPVFVATTEADPYRARGFTVLPVAEEATLALDGFSLEGKRRADIRHSVATAKRYGLRVVAWEPSLADGVAEVSRAWLATKRGGEMGFTLGHLSGPPPAGVVCRVVVDDAGQVLGFVTWHTFDDDNGRVVDVMRRRPDAPNPTMDFLIASSLLDFAAAGVRHASLSSVPISHGPLAERVYPAASLRHFKNKFAPQWETRWLAAPARRHLPGALRAVAHAYCPGGLGAALRQNR